MKYILSLAFIIALVTGCTISTVNFPDVYAYCNWTIIADERFTIDERTELSEALDDWHSVVPAAKFRVFYQKLADKYEVEDNIIHIHYGYLADMDTVKSIAWTEWKFYPDATGAEIYVNFEGDKNYSDPYIGEDFSRVVLEHELGHAFGLGHVDPAVRPNDIMNPTSGPGDKITKEDVETFYTINTYCKKETDGGKE